MSGITYTLEDLLGDLAMDLLYRMAACEIKVMKWIRGKNERDLTVT